MDFKVGINCLVVKDGKVLLGKRLKKKEYGTWGLPGGHLELGESFAVAAKRELEEETGLIADEAEFFSVVNSPENGEHWVQINFVIPTWHGELLNREPDVCAAWEWFALGSLPENVTLFHKAVLSSYSEGKNLVEVDLRNTH